MIVPPWISGAVELVTRVSTKALDAWDERQREKARKKAREDLIAKQNDPAQWMKDHFGSNDT